METLAEIADALDELPLDECMHVLIGSVDKSGLATAAVEDVREGGGDHLGLAIG